MHNNNIDMTIFNDFITKIKMDEHKTYKNLTVLPLNIDHSISREYAFLDDVLKNQKLIITEITEGGSVPNLKVTNNADQDVLILEGEELIGAKQNRIVNTSVIVGKKSEILIPVSCVERGRWGYKSRSFSSGKSHSYTSLRRKKSKSVSANLRRKCSFASDQQEVWNDIDEKSQAFHVHSKTEAMQDIYESIDDKMLRYEDALKIDNGHFGCITFISGNIVSFDVFGSESIFKRTYSKLLKGYIFEAIRYDSNNGNGRFPIDIQVKSRDFLSKIKSSLFEAYKSVGKGYDIRFESKELNGFALLNDGEVVHSASFAR